jgi:hypothetical protein
VWGTLHQPCHKCGPGAFVHARATENSAPFGCGRGTPIDQMGCRCLSSPHLLAAPGRPPTSCAPPLLHAHPRLITPPSRAPSPPCSCALRLPGRGPQARAAGKDPVAARPRRCPEGRRPRLADGRRRHPCQDAACDAPADHLLLRLLFYPLRPLHAALPFAQDVAQCAVGAVHRLEGAPRDAPTRGDRRGRRGRRGRGQRGREGAAGRPGQDPISGCGGRRLCPAGSLLILEDRAPCRFTHVSHVSHFTSRCLFSSSPPLPPRMR